MLRRGLATRLASRSASFAARRSSIRALSFRTRSHVSFAVLGRAGFPVLSVSPISANFGHSSVHISRRPSATSKTQSWFSKSHQNNDDLSPDRARCSRIASRHLFCVLMTSIPNRSPCERETRCPTPIDQALSVNHSAPATLKERGANAKANRRGDPIKCSGGASDPFRRTHPGNATRFQRPQLRLWPTTDQHPTSLRPASAAPRQKLKKVATWTNAPLVRGRSLRLPPLAPPVRALRAQTDNNMRNRKAAAAAATDAHRRRPAAGGKAVLRSRQRAPASSNQRPAGRGSGPAGLRPTPAHRAVIAD